jgi:hypothetical protein
MHSARLYHTAYSNRAACHTHLSAYAAASEDADRCIALEPAWGKGYSRRAYVMLLTKEYGLARPGQPIAERSPLVNMTVFRAVTFVQVSCP